MNIKKEQMFKDNTINVSVGYLLDPEEYDVCSSEEQYKMYYNLSGNVILSQLESEGDDYLFFYCGPECMVDGDTYLSDSATIDCALKYLLRDSEYENCFDIGASESNHIISDYYKELSGGKTLEDAYNFLKDKLMEYDNVKLVEK